MQMNYYEKDKLLIFKIMEEIDEFSVKELRRKADYEIERFMPREVIFDFDCVTFMDSAGIGMIIGRYKQVGIIGGVTEVANLSNSVKRIFRMSGMLKIIPEIDLKERLKDIESKENSKEVINLWEIKLQIIIWNWSL